jgi:lipopolysaccharide/colanic/teichoic acid biosynthesis glycosyltransferase
MATKRLLDVVGAVAVMTLLSPVFLTVAILNLAFLGRPILFRQVRPGHEGKLFRLLKFRTMLDLHDSHGALLPDEDRLTAFGKFLRTTSLDELPEFWNVLVGDMSLVGPRPLLVEYLPLYSPAQARRHAMRPGITGWAQVHGRNALSWEEKFELDVWYVDHWSLSLDIRILLMTVRQVLSGKGIAAELPSTMRKFKGPEPSHDA